MSEAKISATIFKSMKEGDGLKVFWLHFYPMAGAGDALSILYSAVIGAEWSRWCSKQKEMADVTWEAPHGVSREDSVLTFEEEGEEEEEEEKEEECDRRQQRIWDQSFRSIRRGPDDVHRAAAIITLSQL